MNVFVPPPRVQRDDPAKARSAAFASPRVAFLCFTVSTIHSLSDLLLLGCILAVLSQKQDYSQ